MNQSRDLAGVGLVAAAAVGFGLSGPLARVGEGLGFNAVTFAIWRTAGSVAALVAMLAIAVAMGWATRVPLRTLGRYEHLQLLVTGLYVAGTSLGIFLAFEHTTIGLALITFYTYPAMVAVAATRLYDDPLGPRRTAAILLAAAGMVLLVLDPAATEGQDLALLGVLFALVAALCQAGYALVSARGFRSVPAFQAATIQRGWSLLILLVTLVPIVLLIGDAPRLVGPLDGVDAWLLIIVAGVFSAGLPAAGLVAGYRRVGPTRGAVLMLLEPLTGVLLAAWFLAEQPTPLQLLGGLLVLIGATIVQQARSGRVTAPAALSAE